MRFCPKAAALLLIPCSIAIGSSRKQQRDHGAALFASSGCLHCHSIGDVGGHRGPDLSDVGRTTRKTAIRRQIINGSNIMPPFRDVLAPAEINDLVAYLRSCRNKRRVGSPASGQ